MRGALKGAGAAWLGLIALQAVSTDGATGRIRGAFAVLQGIVARALDPTLPAIPDLRAGGTWGGGPVAAGSEMDPQDSQNGPKNDPASPLYGFIGPIAPTPSTPRLPVPSSPTNAQPFAG